MTDRLAANIDTLIDFAKDWLRRNPQGAFPSNFRDITELFIRQHTRIRELEAALGEALDGWEFHQCRPAGLWDREPEDRIATLRRLLEGKR